MKSFILVPCTCKASTVLRAFTHTISFVPHNSHCRKADHVTVLWMKNPAVIKPKLEVSCHGHICESCRELSKCSHSQASLTALLITLGLRSRNLYIKTFLRWFWRSQSMTRSLRSSAHMNKSRGAQILWQVSFYYPNFKPFWSIWTLITMIALWIKPYHYTASWVWLCIFMTPLTGAGLCAFSPFASPVSSRMTGKRYMCKNYLNKWKLFKSKED